MTGASVTGASVTGATVTGATVTGAGPAAGWTEEGVAMTRPPGGRVLFVGAVHEALPALEALLASTAQVVEVITVPAAGGRVPSGYVDLQPVAAARGIPVRRTANLNEAGEVGHVRALAPDLIVVVGWTRLLGPQLLAIPPRGCVGFHASLLPRHRGRAPVNWAIILGEEETGNTMMFLDATADTGDIIDQRRVRIEPADTCASVYDKVARAGAAMLAEHLPALLSGTAPRRPQGPPAGDALPKRTPDMGITDWSRPRRAVHDWIRALTSPYPGAFTSWSGRRVMLWAAARPPDGPARPGRAQPGEILRCGPEGVQVAAGDGPLLVTSMSWPGQAPEPAGRWARDHRLAPGGRFDEVDEATSRWALGLGPAPGSGGPPGPGSGRGNGG